MKAKVNSHVIKARNIASYPLGVLGSIAHPIKEDGEYLGTISLKKQVIARFRLKVDADIKETQVDIDLAELHKQKLQKGSEQMQEYKLNSNGYLMFFVSSGSGGYHVVLNKIAGKRSKSTFDSKSLSNGDLFILTLVRPGEYELIEKSSKNISKITVDYPKIEKTPFSPNKPINIDVTEEGFNMKSKIIKIDPGQGIVLQIKSAKSAILAKLIKSNDGPGDKGRSKKKHSWVNPRKI